MASPLYDLTRRYTVDEVMAFPEDGNRYELVGGELLVSSTPRFAHQRVVMRLNWLLGDYLRQFGLLETLFCVGGDITWGSKDTLVIPDLFILPPDEQADPWTSVRNLRLVIEVLSPSTARNDRFRKRVVYQRYGVETYWIVDIDNRQIEVWTPKAETPVIHTDTISWSHAPDVEPLTIDLSTLWP